MRQKFVSISITMCILMSLFNDGVGNPPEQQNNRYQDGPRPTEDYHHFHLQHRGPSNLPTDFIHQHHHHNHHNHDDREFEVENEDSSFSATLTNSTEIPLEFAKHLNEFNEQDLLFSVIEGGPNLNQPIIQTRFFSTDDDDNVNATERKQSQVARPAKCMPELTTVKIIESNDPNVFFVPECTRIERCGGCCSHTLLSCQAVESETVTFSVLKTEYTGQKKLKYVGKEPVVVEKHTKCKCGCKIKAKHCTQYQEYKESECRCLCKNTDEEKKCYKNSYLKLWNPEQCACQCREVIPCSTGYDFDYNECRCKKNQLDRRYVLKSSYNKETPPQDEQDQN